MPVAVRPTGAQLSTRAVAFFGVSLIWAAAGDAIKTIANIRVFIGFSRNGSYFPIEPDRSQRVYQGGGGMAAEFLDVTIKFARRFVIASRVIIGLLHPYFRVTR
jgi:hypothetical protein